MSETIIHPPSYGMPPEVFQIYGPVRQDRNLVPPVQKFDYAQCIGRGFNPTGQLFPSEFEIRDWNEQHFLVWVAVSEDSEQDYCFMTFLPELHPRLVFNTEASRDVFDSWFSSYQERFPNGDTKSRFLPPLPMGEISGYSLERSPGIDSQPRDMMQFDEWCWIVKNCQKSVYFTDDRIVFEDVAEATHYKLRFR